MVLDLVILPDRLMEVGVNIICALWLSFYIQLLLIDPGIDLV